MAVKTLSSKETGKRARGQARFNVYVIELDAAVLEKSRFRKANPDYVEGMPCAYVGMTACSPEERFRQHKSGYKSGRYVQEYGTRLRPKQFRAHNPMAYDEACRMEREKARRLRKKGWAVWQK